MTRAFIDCTGCTPTPIFVANHLISHQSVEMVLQSPQPRFCLLFPGSQQVAISHQLTNKFLPYANCLSVRINRTRSSNRLDSTSLDSISACWLFNTQHNWINGRRSGKPHSASLRKSRPFSEITSPIGLITLWIVFRALQRRSRQEDEPVEKSPKSQLL